MKNGYRIYALILAAGKGERAGFEHNKMFQEFAGTTPLRRCLETFSGVQELDGIAVVSREEESDIVRRETKGIKKNIVITSGGDKRQDSVYNGLIAIRDKADIAVIHDGARCFVSEDLIKDCISSCIEYGSGVAGKMAKDTIKEVDDNGVFKKTLDRSHIAVIETPQVFFLRDILSAHEEAMNSGLVGTDDSSLMEAMGKKVRLVDGRAPNEKLTYYEDFEKAEMEHMPKDIRVGQGYDIHRLVEGRELILGGIRFGGTKGLLGHSDGDAVLHAVTDALFGAASLGDIGDHFPDNDDRYRGADSALLLKEAADIVRGNRWIIGNVDITVFLEEPKLGSKKREMRKRISEILEIDPEKISVKAKTFEKLGPVGRGEAIAASATCMICR